MRSEQSDGSVCQPWLVPSICRAWNLAEKSYRVRADHIGVFVRMGGLWRSTGEDRAVRRQEDLEGSEFFATLGPLLIEFRYTFAGVDGHYAYDMSGRLLDSHAGPEGLFPIWSELSLLEGATRFKLDLYERERSWVLDNKTLRRSHIPNPNEVKSDCYLTT